MSQQTYLRDHPFAPAPLDPEQETNSASVTTLYIGDRMRFVATDTGGKIEVMNGADVWVEQADYSET